MKTSQRKFTYRFDGFLSVVDTPGVWNYKDSQQKITDEVKDSMILVSPGPHAILFCVAMTRFDKTDIETMQFYSRLFGDDLRKFVIVVFTHFDEWQRKHDDQNNLDRKVYDFLLQLPDEYKWFVTEDRYVFFDNKTKSPDEECKALIKKITNLNGDRMYYTNEKFKEIEKKAATR